MKKKVLWTAFAVVSVVCLLWVLSLFTGDGGLKRITTLSGVYTVEKPSGYPVVCFIEKSSGSMECLEIKKVQ